MKMLSRILALPSGLGLLVLALGACGGDARANTGSGAENAPLPLFQQRLLELAFDAATALPVEPHLKTRSRVQEGVIEACLELDQPARAIQYCERIQNWRRGACLADIAFHLAEGGDEPGARRLLEQAEEVARRPAEEDDQEWRRDRIKMKIACAHLWLGDDEKASLLEAGVVESESGLTDAVRVRLLEAEDMDSQLARLDEALTAGNLDQARAALDAFAHLFDRFFDDEERRTEVEERVRAGGLKLPPDVRMEPMLRMAAFALEHDDPPKAMQWVDEAAEVLASFTLTVEFRLPLIARLAELRFRAGDVTKARNELDAGLVLYETERETIVDMFRGEAIRPLAEAYLATGDKSGARRVYGMAVEEGAKNPNARPRAADLASNCSSMARRGFEPDAALWSRLLAIREGLVDPW